MKLTDRDIEILQFINEFGFCEIDQISRKFGLKKPRCYQIMKRLRKADLVRHERVFHGKNGIFYLSKQGASYSDLAPLKNIPKDNYVHQLTIIEVYLGTTALDLAVTYGHEETVQLLKSSITSSDYCCIVIIIISDIINTEFI